MQTILEIMHVYLGRHEIASNLHILTPGSLEPAAIMNYKTIILGRHMF